MKSTQDRATSPLSAIEISKTIVSIKEMGAEYVAISTPYEVPGGDATAQTKMWCDAIRNQNMKVWHRHSWPSDEGWYGVPKDEAKDRIQDTKNWILAHKELFRNGDIFCPKPEPQNMGIGGVNGNGKRFADKTAFNKWLRDMTIACRDAFSSLGLSVEVGYWGFDGFVVCGYNNPDWQGKSFLEPATVQLMLNEICCDHYPAPSGKPMSDFLKVFKQAWPEVHLVIGEYGTTGANDKVVQLKEVFADLKADLSVTGINYWQAGPDGADVALLNNDFTLNALGQELKKQWAGITPTPVPIPQPQPQPLPVTDLKSVLDAIADLRKAVDSRDVLELVETTAWGAGSLSDRMKKIKILVPNT